MDRAEKGQEGLRRVAARISALGVVLPRIVARILRFRGYDLEQVTRGLTGLLRHDGLRGWNRAMAQRALQLPVDPADEEVFARGERVEGVSF